MSFQESPMAIWHNMVVYRICLKRYAGSLQASGRAARWNSNDIQLIYTSSSRALACLENIVHRSQRGLNQAFQLLTIEIESDIRIETIQLNDLADSWREYWQMSVTQKIGDLWISTGNSVLLQVPSSIIAGEHNFLINPLHADFKKIRIIKTDEFIFDDRIKL